MAIGRRELCSLFPAVLLSGAWVSSDQCEPGQVL